MEDIYGNGKGIGGGGEVVADFGEGEGYGGKWFDRRVGCYLGDDAVV
ncbi:hypothetical protein [Siminovitchia fortis]|nr:hypothetical protein [Siminovitchia fortis]